MKHRRICSFVAILVFSLAARTVQAQPQTQQKTAQPAKQAAMQPATTSAPVTIGRGWYYADSDSNGVCDNLGMRMGRNAVDAGAGAPVGRGMRGRRTVLNTYAQTSRTVSQPVSTTAGAEAARPLGRGWYYADADSNGVCDNLGMQAGRSAVPARMSGRQNRGGRNRRK